MANEAPHLALLCNPFPLACASAQLYDTGRAEVAGSSLFMDHASGLIWMTDGYGQDAIAASGVSPADCVSAVVFAETMASIPHLAEVAW
jgi:hypothetical protein